ncbi:hypothetical protein MICCA_3050015 [Microcystis aeruginosa PCC 9432]|uniref:Uncharacterized protein n=1 Tax=Microcystis aeruginosa PCC 9432 TaxID=1160280 RepID=A0A822LEV4_MICAE|nr:hypothetical protein FXO09_19435 [Microcystis aeruginosa KLA2]CCH93405.1 hypothetical protein MICCA_3050015 [Microcystis aeruginosa PCC 9432]
MLDSLILKKSSYSSQLCGVLSDLERSYLCGLSSRELGTWNPYTRSNTGQSLGCLPRESVSL